MSSNDTWLSLAEHIQAALQAERVVRSDMYEPGSGQTWGHVDHRISRIVAESLLASPLWHELTEAVEARMAAQDDE